MTEQKQIEEMAVELSKVNCKKEGCGFCYLEYGPLENSCEEYLTYKKMAEDLYNAGYRKQIEGEWIRHGYKWQCSNCGVLMDIDGTPNENLYISAPTAERK